MAKINEKPAWVLAGEVRNLLLTELIDGFKEVKELLWEHVLDGRLLYVYTNGFVLVNRPNIQGGLLNNDATVYWDEYLKEQGLREDSRYSDTLKDYNRRCARSYSLLPSEDEWRRQEWVAWLNAKLTP